MHVVSDGRLITGQNPASSGPAARLLLDALSRQAKLEGGRLKVSGRKTGDGMKMAGAMPAITYWARTGDRCAGL